MFQTHHLVVVLELASNWVSIFVTTTQNQQPPFLIDLRIPSRRTGERCTISDRSTRGTIQPDVYKVTNKLEARGRNSQPRW